MKAKFGIFLLLLLLFAGISQSQEGECSAEAIAARAAEAQTSYLDAASRSSDAEAALDSLSDYQFALAAIESECDETRFQEYRTEGTELLTNLRAGGYVLYVRHTSTNAEEEDRDLSSCESQRNLSELGRIEAAQIGEVWQGLNIQISYLVSTEYCRTRDTAAAFGEPTIINKEDLLTLLPDLLAEIPAEGTITVIVGHVDLLEEATGIQVPEDTLFNEGDALVFRPLGGPMNDAGYELLGRISFRNWSDLSRIAAEE
jgi:phosphohistidine phosphatase SixA